jgi:hypothetical protein
VALGLKLSSISDLGELHDRVERVDDGQPFPKKDYDARVASIHDKEVGAVVGLCVAGALAGGAVAAFFLEGRAAEEEEGAAAASPMRWTLAPWLGQQAGLAVSGRF